MQEALSQRLQNGGSEMWLDVTMFPDFVGTFHEWLHAVNYAQNQLRLQSHANANANANQILF